MNLKCGLIGLPNVGKSTLFNALTKLNARVANFPFCTIHPNIGIVSVPDLRIDQLANIVKPQRKVLTSIEFIDIAGLVKGASLGEGLGNQFLAKIRETKVIGHVVRCFEKDDIIHVSGKICPTEDINTINTELILADLQMCENAIFRLEKLLKNCSMRNISELITLKKCYTHLTSDKVLRTLDISNEEKKILNHLGFLTLKPMMYIANIKNNEFINNSYLDEVFTIAKTEGAIVIAICVKLEIDSARFHRKKRKNSVKKSDFKESDLNGIIQAGYKLLNQQTYFTVGTNEVRAWSIPFHTTAPQAAAKIHTEFEKRFIRAQVISFADFIKYKGEQGAKKAGKVRFEGKKYIVQDGDIINFLLNR